MSDLLSQFAPAADYGFDTVDDEDDDPDAANDPINQIELQVSVHGLKDMNIHYTHTQGCHGRGKTGNLDIHFSRRGKDIFIKNYFEICFTSNTGKI